MGIHPPRNIDPENIFFPLVFQDPNGRGYVYLGEGQHEKIGIWMGLKCGIHLQNGNFTSENDDCPVGLGVISRQSRIPLLGLIIGIVS